ncbi:hypothetical protein AMTRI_Chr06g172890 [Amborella trichopoda]
MAAKLMKALRYGRYGGGVEGLKHVEIPIPSPKKDDVLFKLEAASLNPADCKIQKGMARPFLPRKLLFVPDVAGEVVEVGFGVQNFKVGDKVVTMLNFMMIVWDSERQKGGGLAECAVASKTLMVERPPEVSALEGATLPMAVGLKLEKNSTNKETNVLITAASGGVGNIHVTASCGARNIELVKSLGADEVIDYKTPEGYDVIHCATNIPWSTFEPNLSEHGKVIDINILLVPLLVLPKGEDLECMLGSVRDGKIKAVIDSKSPLAKAEEEWVKMMDRHATGKIIVTSDKREHIGLCDVDLFIYVGLFVLAYPALQLLECIFLET